jgi:hypothetical protein
MKRVKYAFGAAAMLAPGAVVLAAAGAPAAAAATAHGHERPAPAKASSQKRVLTPLSPCTGQTLFHVESGSYMKSIVGWEANAGTYSLCIGTVRVDREFIHKNCTSMTFAVSYGQYLSKTWRSTINNVCGNANTVTVVSEHIKRTFPRSNSGDLRMVIASKYGSVVKVFNP